MIESNSTNLDPVGLKTLSESFKISVQTANDFLKAICLPFSEEFGLYLKDKVHNWRIKNNVNTINKAEVYYKKYNKINGLSAHPRLIAKIVERSSWIDNSPWG